MAATIAPISPATSTVPVTPVTTAQLTLQPGTVISAQVIQLLENGLAQIAIDGLAIAALSEVPLQVGDALKLAVSQASDGVIKLAIVPQGASAAGGVPTTTAGAATAATGGATSIGTTSAPSSAQAVSTSTPSTPVSAEAAVIAVATQAAAPRQQSLSPLFANLPVVVASDAVPPAVQAGASQLLALRPELSSQLTASDLRTAFDQSGLFLEAGLASGNAPMPSTDLKAALVTFRDAVTNWLAASGEGAVAAAPAQVVTPSAPSLAPTQTAAAEAARVVTDALPSTAIASGPLVPPEPPQQTTLPQQLAPQIPGVSTTATLAQRAPSATNLIIAALEAAQQPLEGEAVRGTPQTNVLASIKALQAILSVAAITRSPAETPSQTALQPAHALAAAAAQSDAASAPPPFRGAAPAAQAIAQASLAPEAAAKDIGQHLLEQTDGAIARQTLLQVASLPDRVDAAGTPFNAQVSDTSSQRWHFEIPFATPQGTALAQFEIERDGTGNQVEATSQKVWRARFTLNIEPTGPVHALVSLAGDKTAVRMWAERPETAAKIRAQSSVLVQALRAAELEPGDIVISGGAPPQGPAKVGHFLDRAS
jgi:Flagellar hook-length control protein FliK